MDITLEPLTFENCNRAYEIDRSDIPDAFVDNVPIYRLVFFVLDKNFRSQGYGSQIIETTIKKVFTDFGKRPIILGVHKDNKKAEKFYLNHGFVKTSYIDEDDFCFILNSDDETITTKRI